MQAWNFQDDPCGWEPVSGCAEWHKGLGWKSLPKAITGYINHELTVRFQLAAIETVSRIQFRGFTPCGPTTSICRVSFFTGTTLNNVRRRQYLDVPAKQALYMVDFHAFTPISALFIQIDITPLPVVTYPATNYVQTPGTMARATLNG
jgi:hypothetical protein